MRYGLPAAIIALCLLYPSAPARACTGLGCTCSVSVSDVAFGTYDFLAGNHDAAGSVQVTCSALVIGVAFSYTVAADAGLWGSFTNRAMSSGGNSLNYNFFTDASRTQVWGDGSGATAVISDSYILSLLVPEVRNYSIYGRISGGQVVPPGAYSDTITVTVVY